MQLVSCFSTHIRQHFMDGGLFKTPNLTQLDRRQLATACHGTDGLGLQL
jgi:hypothetical protein